MLKYYKKMKTDLVLVEREDVDRNTIIGSSGLLLNEKYAITTANVLFDRIGSDAFEKMQPGKLYADFPMPSTIINVIRKEKEGYDVKKVKKIFAFVSHKIKNSSNYIFQNWAIDSIDNNRNLNKVMSLFFVLTTHEAVGVKDFKNTLGDLLDLIIKFDINKGGNIYIKSVPFANRNFMNSISKGIVSNVLGNSSCILLSDCPCSPGCEGSPVYPCNSDNLNDDVPMGLVLSSLSWWRGEWVGLTLMADLRPIILELLDVPIRMLDMISKTENLVVVESAESCLVQIYCGRTWGTAILLSHGKGIFITNAHVTENENLLIFHKGRCCNAEIIYRTPQNGVFDLAIVKSEPEVLKNHGFNLKPIPVSRKQCISGDTVYSAGYLLFTKECDPTPSLSKGCISQVNTSMIKTTCSVHPGSSGGAILDTHGALVGIIVCNARLENNNVTYPRINMAVPFSAIQEILLDYIETGDPVVLNGLHVKNKEAEFVWKRIEGKL